MKSGVSIFNSIFIAYVAWVIIIVINFIFTTYTSDFIGKIGADMSQYYITMLVTTLIVIHGIGATLAWHTQKKKNWAKWLFIVFCLAFAMDLLFSLLQITEMYKHTNNENGFKKTIAIIVWCMFAVMAWFKSSNKPFKPTPKSGAV